MASVIFRLPRCTTETVHNHVNRFYMRLSVVQSSMLVHLNQNNKRRKVSSGMEMHASIKHQTFFINLNVLVLSGRLFYCKNFFPGRLKQTFSRLSPVTDSYFDLVNICSKFNELSPTTDSYFDLFNICSKFNELSMQYFS